jgi:hypothetical protein
VIADRQLSGMLKRFYPGTQPTGQPGPSGSGFFLPVRNTVHFCVQRVHSPKGDAQLFACLLDISLRMSVSA